MQCLICNQVIENYILILKEKDNYGVYHYDCFREIIDFGEWEKGLYK